MKSSLLTISTALLFGNLPTMAVADEITDATEIYAAQRVLYERNWGDAENFPDGVLGRMTRQMIREYQEKLDLPATGELSQELYDGLMEFGPTSWAWGAIGASTDGAYASYWSYATREEAARGALSDCRARSSSPHKCSVATTFYDGETDTGWIAAVNCDGYIGSTQHLLITLNARQSRGEAIDDAYKYAASHGYARKLCKLLTVIAADGSHK